MIAKQLADRLRTMAAELEETTTLPTPGSITLGDAMATLRAAFPDQLISLELDVTSGRYGDIRVEWKSYVSDQNWSGAHATLDDCVRARLNPPSQSLADAEAAIAGQIGAVECVAAGSAL